MTCSIDYRNKVSHAHRLFNCKSTLPLGTNITVYDMTLTEWREINHYTYRQAFRFIERGQLVAIRSGNQWRVDSTSFEAQ